VALLRGRCGDFARCLVVAVASPSRELLRGASYLPRGLYRIVRTPRLLRVAAIPIFGQQLLDPRVAGMLERGEQFLGSREFDQAIDDFKAVLALDPSVADAYNGLGVAYIGKNDLAQAADEFRAGLRLDPRNAEASSNLGMVLLRTGKTEEAVQALRAAVGMAPSSATNHYRLGLALSTSGHPDLALEEFSAALKLIGNMMEFRVTLTSVNQRVSPAPTGPNVFYVYPG